LTVDQAIPCALILNELVTNALTHAFPGERTGTIDIQVFNEGDRVNLVIRDDGIGIAVEDPDRLSGMGFRIVRTLAMQLRATLKIERERGTVVTVAFTTKPLSQERDRESVS
jgi:two-component sensor histidine kinase